MFIFPNFFYFSSFASRTLHLVQYVYSTYSYSYLKNRFKILLNFNENQQLEHGARNSLLMSHSKTAFRGTARITILCRSILKWIASQRGQQKAKRFSLKVIIFIDRKCANHKICTNSSSSLLLGTGIYII